MLPESHGPEPQTSASEPEWHFAKFYKHDSDEPDAEMDDWETAVKKHSFTGRPKYLGVSLCIVETLKRHGMDGAWTNEFLGRKASGEEPVSLVIPGVGSHKIDDKAGIYVMNMLDISPAKAKEIRDMMDVGNAHQLWEKQNLHFHGRTFLVECMDEHLKSGSSHRIDLNYLGTTSNARNRQSNHNSFCPTKTSSQFNSIVVHAANSVMQGSGLAKRFSLKIIVTEDFIKASILPEVQQHVPGMTLEDVRYCVEGVMGASLDRVNSPGGKVRDHGHRGVPAASPGGGYIFQVRFSLNLSSLEHDLRCAPRGVHLLEPTPNSTSCIRNDGRSS